MCKIIYIYMLFLEKYRFVIASEIKYTSKASLGININ